MRFGLPLLAGFGAVLLAGSAAAQPALSRPAVVGRSMPVTQVYESTPVVSPRAEVVLVSEAASVAPGVPFRIGLRQRLAPGWHTYWRNPGDAGQATEIALDLPEGGAAGPIEWPSPSRFAFGPLVNFGYATEVLLPLTVTPPATLAPGGVFSLQAEASWLVCADVCIPEEGRFSISLPVAAVAEPSPAAAAFVTAEAATPRPSPWAVTAGFDGPRGSVTLSGPGLAPGTVREAFFFPDEPGLIDNAAPQPMRLRDGALTLGLRRDASAATASLSGVVAMTDAAGVRSAYLVATPMGAPEPEVPSLPLWQALLLAMAGGLLLNLMPCVFPVLAMKAMAIARMGGAARGAVRAEALSYTAGVLVAFAVLGGAMLAFRAAGGLAGWGFQFQSPVFVAVMAWLMLGVGLNLSGVFAVGGPVGAGSALAARGGHAGSFMTGALAVLVATPCTAPFMAAAVGAAFALPAAGTMAVFLALGLGLAAPYAALAVWPGLARGLPRPGAWMERLRQALAFPMYAAAAWLVWVLAQQSGPDGVLMVLGGGLLLGFGAWALGAAQAATGRGRRLGQAVALASVIGALALLPPLRVASPAVAVTPTGVETWSAARIAALRAEGRPALVNMTAAWCITCKVNDRLALETEATRALLLAGGIAYLKGDWTRGDPAITALLREHGREGVPLYLFYPAGGGAPMLLPQVLTEGILRRAIGA
ncbi:protein-disulfide reductase DsbD family protein [Humitalea sp. 24SJ18S-53]|uniref:protein-disulfide reductase DsbD family protein n=1 Tax=Humitalea sp. 24SJ18S-53 TaxID=3422307 RepID=UPI003D67D533